MAERMVVKISTLGDSTRCPLYTTSDQRTVLGASQVACSPCQLQRRPASLGVNSQRAQVSVAQEKAFSKADL